MLPYNIEEETENVFVQEEEIFQANYKKCFKFSVDLEPCYKNSQKKYSVM